MLKKRQQKEHFDAEWESMQKHLLNYYATQNPEALHQFRVQVKKIKAMLLFLQDHPASKQLKALQSIFKHAGRIRSAWINLRLFDQYQLAGAASKKKQENILVNETRRFYAKQKTYTKTLEKIQPLLAGDFRDVDNGSIVRLYKKRLKKISRFFARSGNTIDQLHQTRKKIKILLYLHTYLPKRLAGTLRLNTSYLDQLQDTIGKWHDVVLASDLLKKEGFEDKKVMGQLERRSTRLNGAIGALSDGFKGKAVLS